MIHAATAEPQRIDPPIRKIVLLGVTLSQIPLWYATGSTRFIVLWLVAIGLSAACARLVPPPRRWLVGLGSLVSFLSVLSVDVREQVFRYGDLEKVWFVIVPLLSVALVHLYLLLIRRAVPLPDADTFSAERSLSQPSAALRWQRGLALLIALHGLGVGLYWAYTDHACTWFDLVRRVQGCALVRTLPSFPAHTTEVQFAPSGTLVASVAPVTYTESLLLASPLTTETWEAFQQHIRTEANTISLWDLKSGQLLRTLEQPARPFEMIFSPNDQLVATRGADDQTRIWRVDDGRLLHTLPSAKPMAFSADGSLLATANDDGVQLWSMQDGTLLRMIALTHDVQLPVEMTFSPDGSLLAMRDFSEVELWRVSDGTLLHRLDTRQSAFEDSLFFAPDGQTLATTGRYFDEGESGDGVRLWRVADGTLLHTLRVNQVLSEEQYTRNIEAAAFSPDGTRLAVGLGRWPPSATILIWQVADGALLEHIDGVVAADLIRFNADGTALQIYDIDIPDLRIYTQRITQ